MSETICIPFERVTSELVDATDASLCKPAVPDPDPVRVEDDEARAGAVVLDEISGRRGEGPGRREGETAVDGDGDAKALDL